MGIIMKLAFVGIVAYHLMFGSVQGIWVPFALVDLVLCGFFFAALRTLSSQT